MTPGMRNALAVAALLLLCGLVSAQPTDTEARLREQLRETTLELRRAQDENAALRARQQEQQSAAAAAPAAAQPAEPDRTGALRKSLSDRDRRIADLQQQLSEYEEKQKAWQDANSKATDLLRQRDAQVSQLEGQAKQLQAAYQQLQASGRSCEEKNTQLVVISGELLKHYEDKGVWSALRDAEPLTRIHRIELEKLAQDYQIKIKDRTLKAAPASKPPGQP
jgi:DNA repair exonuclease SbcCD ATPase subunit